MNFRYYPFLLLFTFLLSVRALGQGSLADSTKMRMPPKPSARTAPDKIPVPTGAERVAIRRLEKDLLGKFYISSLTAGQVLPAYQYFVQQVKARREQWETTDWDRADFILQKLHWRRQNLEAEIPMADMARIKLLQLQYRSLETGQDAQEWFDNEPSKKRE